MNAFFDFCADDYMVPVWLGLAAVLLFVAWNELQDQREKTRRQKERCVSAWFLYRAVSEYEEESLRCELNDSLRQSKMDVAAAIDSARKGA